MKNGKYLFCTLLIFCLMQSVAAAQSIDVNEKLKTYFNEVSQEAGETVNAVEKRELINDSLDEMTDALNRIQHMAPLNEENLSAIRFLKSDLAEMQNELNGMDGYERVDDTELDEFVDYVQQSMEQAINRTITISAGTAIIIVLLLLLL